MREEHLRAFLAVADTGSVTKAADAVGTTQSTVSRRIAALEKEIGTVLFARSPTGAHLTPAGEAYLARTPQMQAAFRTANPGNRAGTAH